MHYKAECTVKYRYKCEKCGYLTKWSESAISRTAYHSLNSTRVEIKAIHDPKNLEKAKTKSLEDLDRLVSAFKQVIAKIPSKTIIPEEPYLAEYYKDVFSLGKACPRCLRRQTWYSAVAWPISKRKYALRYAIIILILGNILGFIAIHLLFANIGITFFYQIAAQPIFLLFGGLIGYAIAAIRVKLDKRHYKSASRHNIPEIEWSEPIVELMGLPEAEFEIETDVKSSYIGRIINKPNTKKEALGYWYLCNLKHDNILYIHSVDERGNGVFRIVEEKCKGVSLSRRLKRGINESDFKDYILQLCDALEFLHQQEPAISHNAVSADNIWIGKKNLLKLTGYDKVTLGGSSRRDIAMLCSLIEGVKGRYIKHYKKIIENPDIYQSIEDFREAFVAIDHVSFPKVTIGVVIALLIVGIAVARILADL